jgi:hypothetical protein
LLSSGSPPRERTFHSLHGDGAASHAEPAKGGEHMAKGKNMQKEKKKPKKSK